MRILLVALALAGALPACDDDDGGDMEGSGGPDCDGDDVPGYADVDIFATCTMCHSSTLSGPDRNGALVTVNFDTYAAAMASAAKALDRVRAGAMPPPSSGLSVTEAQADELERWVLCDTPE
ncbi:MAG TPA: hypothetical protein VFG69_05775 [Nannocystaceae bacterium]|nr:hypothetical protein [Nannocystaceae bacterium]